MATFYRQTDANINCALAAFCSGLNAAPTEQSTEIDEGSLPGTTEETISIGSVDTKQRAYYMQPALAPSTDFDWNTGNWVVRIDITTASMDTFWEDSYICRVNSACTSQATIGSLIDQNISLGSTGVKTMTVSGLAQTPSVGDSFVVVLAFSTTSHAGSSAGITPDRFLDTPLTPVGAGVPVAVGFHDLKVVEEFPASPVLEFFRRRFQMKHLRSRYA